ncbi:MAG TPA: hypothetical protein VG389_13490 [Myxococcota bacterium]|jgi:hypothetical protein|nr:hypothetical protein [Myxococcota bacterium]
MNRVCGAPEWCSAGQGAASWTLWRLMAFCAGFGVALAAAYRVPGAGAGDARSPAAAVALTTVPAAVASPTLVRLQLVDARGAALCGAELWEVHVTAEARHATPSLALWRLGVTDAAGRFEWPLAAPLLLPGEAAAGGSVLQRLEVRRDGVRLGWVAVTAPPRALAAPSALDLGRVTPGPL